MTDLGNPWWLLVLIVIGGSKLRFAPLGEGSRSFIIVFALAQVSVVLAMHFETFFHTLDLVQQFVNILLGMRGDEPPVLINGCA